MHKKLILLSFLTVSLVITGCSKDKETAAPSAPAQQNTSNEAPKPAEPPAPRTNYCLSETKIGSFDARTKDMNISDYRDARFSGVQETIDFGKYKRRAWRLYAEARPLLSKNELRLNADIKRYRANGNDSEVTVAAIGDVEYGTSLVFDTLGGMAQQSIKGGCNMNTTNKTAFDAEVNVHCTVTKAMYDDYIQDLPLRGEELFKIRADKAGKHYYFDAFDRAGTYEAKLITHTGGDTWGVEIVGRHIDGVIRAEAPFGRPVGISIDSPTSEFLYEVKCHRR